MGLSAGAKLGPYEIVAPLGEGGMREVYRAHDTRLDAGLAKAQAVAAGADPTLSQMLTSVQTRTAQTAAGMVMGTAPYMAPEQVRGAKIDHRADIFSFGAVLYEMLSGKRAFSGPSSVET